MARVWCGLGLDRLLRLFFFEDEVDDGGVGGEVDLVRDACGDVGDVSGVQDYLFTALNAGSEEFSGAGAGGVGMLALQGAAGDEGEGPFAYDYLVGPELMKFGGTAVESYGEEGAVVAEVVEDLGCEAGWACLGFGE